MPIHSTSIDKKVLIIEDEQKIVRLLTANLESVGMEVVAAATAKAGLAMLADANPDIVLLDIMLPDGEGFAVCRSIRQVSDVPIIILSARVREADKLTGFQCGADDYITKPFSSAELIARVRAVLKRSARLTEPEESELVSGDLIINFRQRKVYKKGVEIKLTSIEYSLLYHLAKNCGRVMLHAELLSRVWGPEYTTEVEYLRAYIWRLRKKIEDNPANPAIIVSSLGIGYSFNVVDRA